LGDASHRADDLVASEAHAASCDVAFLQELTQAARRRLALGTVGNMVRELRRKP
jgi:hypothetical protein